MLKTTFVHFSECEFDGNWEESPTVPQPNIWYNFTSKDEKASLVVTSAHDLDKKTRYEFKKDSQVLVNGTVIKLNPEDAVKHVEVCVPSQKSS